MGMGSSRRRKIRVPRAIAALAAVALLGALPACAVSRACAGGCTVTVDSPTGSETDELGGFVPLLQSFDLSFAGGDRPLWSIGVGARRGGSDAFHLELKDGDGGDRMAGSARYFRWSEGSRVFFGLPEDSSYGVQQFASGTSCTSTCDLTIRDEPDSVFVITGFRFNFPDGENNLRKIGIRPWGRHAASGTRVIRAACQDDDGAERFDIELSYILFPRSWTTRATIAGTDFLAPVPGPRIDVPLNRIWRGSIPLLTGFQLEFGDGDEHVRRLGVDGTDARVVLTLHDDDEAERIHALAWYSAFCEAPLNENVQIQECTRP